ncbi:helix-turn-helix domain-containing protein [Thomasclavelia cocleata]|uniref:helix-turn-helix domain-containing protein n=1 Tax=Thomasclavelia cocleata TaxID=69824 RepID=UPI00242E93D3|nr:helix-turn-helix domain-containing protein [Thomasclavelia cocleata]
MDGLSNRLIKAMKIRGMKQADLVRATGINKGALSCYIKGTYEPKQKNIHLLAKALKVNEAWLMGYETPMEQENEIDSIIKAVANKLNMSESAIRKRYNNSIFNDGTYELTEHGLENYIISDRIYNEDLEADYYENMSKEDSLILIIGTALSNMNYEELKKAEHLLRKSFPNKFPF